MGASLTRPNVNKQPAHDEAEEEDNGNSVAAQWRAFADLLRDKYQPELTARDGALELRALRVDDHARGYCQLLTQLTDVGEVSREDFERRFTKMLDSGAYFVAVIEDRHSGRVVGSATLVLEWKFIHACGARGRIEDVVVDAAARRHALGSLLNRALVDAARHLFDVYKLSLECKDALIPFYERFGYKVDAGNNFLVQRFCD